MVPEPCPSSSLKLSATAEPSPGLGSFPAGICLQSLAPRRDSASGSHHHQRHQPTIIMAIMLPWRLRRSVCLQFWRPGAIPGSGRSSGEGNGNPTPVLLPGKSHGQRSLVGYSPWGREESDTNERLYFTFTFILPCRLVWHRILAHLLPRSALQTSRITQPGDWK